jgi:hypothetical protein
MHSARGGVVVAEIKLVARALQHPIKTDYALFGRAAVFFSRAAISGRCSWARVTSGYTGFLPKF